MIALLCLRSFFIFKVCLGFAGHFPWTPAVADIPAACSSCLINSPCSEQDSVEKKPVDAFKRFDKIFEYEGHDFIVLRGFCCVVGRGGLKGER